MKNELWLEKIKERLDDYSESLPATDWDRFEKKKKEADMRNRSSKIVLLQPRWLVAAVSLVAVSIISVLLLQHSLSEQLNTSKKELAVVNESVMYNNSSHRISTVKNKKNVRLVQTNSLKPICRVVPFVNVKTDTMNLVADHVAKEQEITSEIQNNDTVQNTGLSKFNDSQTKHRYQLLYENTDYSYISKRSIRRHVWSVGLLVGNTGGLSKHIVNSKLPQYGVSYLSSAGRFDLSATSNGMLEIPKGHYLVFKEGIPYLERHSKQIKTAQHKQPISAGITVRKSLKSGFSMETGVVYTYLNSDIIFVGNTESVEQKLHYIGIPLRINWNFWERQPFTFYLSAGGMIEKCVYGKLGNDKQMVKSVQLSVIGMLGAQVNLSRHLGLYIEPGISYFFDDGSDVQTIRKENPCNFTLQGGIRLIY